MKLLGISCTRTTAYHPSANGLVEQFHRSSRHLSWQLSTGWKHYQLSCWVALPSKRTFTVHQLSWCMVQSCVSPGDFFRASRPTDMVEEPLPYVDRLKSTMRCLLAIPTRHHTSQKSFVLPNLLSSSEDVFIWCDTVKRSLQSSYDGPFPVLKRTSKHYTIKVNSQQQTVSIDRLKPAFLKDLDPPQVPLLHQLHHCPHPHGQPVQPHRPLARQTNYLTLSVISCPCWTLGGVPWWTHWLLTYLMVELLLFPVMHYFTIISCMHDYSPPLP